VQEVNTKCAMICLPPALCVAVICRQTVRKAQAKSLHYAIDVSNKTKLQVQIQGI